MVKFVSEQPEQQGLCFLVKSFKEKVRDFIEAMAVGHNYNYIHGNQFIYCTLIAFILFSPFVSCSKKKASLPELKLSNVLASNYTPVISISVEDGIAEKYGVHPEIQYDDNFEPLMTGKVDAKLNALGIPLISGANGADLVLFAGTMSGGHIVFTNKSLAEELKDPKNWKGHSIAVTNQSTQLLVLSAFLKEKYGYSADDVKFKYFDSNQAVIAAVAKGDVDIVPSPYALRDTAVSSGLIQIADLVDYYPDYACCRQTAYGARFRSDRQVYVSWVKGLIESWKLYNSDQKESIRVVSQVTRQDEQWVYDHIYDRERTGYVSYNPDPFYNGVLSQFDACIDQGYINDNHRELAEYFDISVYADALREVIKENPDEQFYKDMWAYFVDHNNKYPNFEKNYSSTI